MHKPKLGALFLLPGLAVAVFALAAPSRAETLSEAQVPVPFPAAAAGAAKPAPPTQPAPVASAGMPIYPASRFLERFDAGKGQQFHLYGTDASFAEIVSYYKSTLKNSGREIFQGPLMHQFELGRFQEDTMAYPPSVVVKDYTWNGAAGYLHVSGTTSARYKTIVQIVPAPDR